MSIKWMNIVWNKSQASGNELLALMAIADEADDRGVSRADRNSLAHKMRIKDPHNVSKIISRVENIGELLIVRKNGLRSIYTILTSRSPDEIAQLMSIIHTGVVSTRVSNLHPCRNTPGVENTHRLLRTDSVNNLNLNNKESSSIIQDDDDDYSIVLKAAGVWKRDRHALKEQNITLADFLAELARCFNDEKVRKPYRIAPMNLLRGDRPAANWYQDDHLKDCIPPAILRVARPDLFIQGTDTPAANEAATEEPAEDVTPIWWKQIDAQLSADMPRTNYRKYVKPARAVLTGNTINITTPNPDWLSSRLESTIRHLAAGVLNMPDIQVQFVQG